MNTFSFITDKMPEGKNVYSCPSPDLYSLFFAGVLTVMDAYNLNYKETKQGESPGVASDLNRSDKDPIFIGGLPRSRALR